jgi:hypothetical protein
VSRRRWNSVAVTFPTPAKKPCGCGLGSAGNQPLVLVSSIEPRRVNRMRDIGQRLQRQRTSQNQHEGSYTTCRHRGSASPSWQGRIGEKRDQLYIYIISNKYETYLWNDDAYGGRDAHDKGRPCTKPSRKCAPKGVGIVRLAPSEDLVAGELMATDEMHHCIVHLGKEAVALKNVVGRNRDGQVRRIPGCVVYTVKTVRPNT